MRNVRILLVDDHEFFRRSVRSFVEAHAQWEVCGEAGDGYEAVEKAKLLQPHVVLMDINMPRMDGLEATRMIRRELPECRVIVVTQQHPSIAREQAASVDAHAFVTKSDLSNNLPSMIQNMMTEGGAAPLPSDMPEDGEATAEEWLRGGGSLARLIQNFDWSKTPLGPITGWPQNLKTIVRVLLTSRFAMWMSWGPELTFLYNDAYARMTLGKKHPWALGKRSKEAWEEIWDEIGPRIEKVLKTGQSTWDEALLLFLERSGYREETYHTFSYSPLFGEDEQTSGHLCVVSEETDRVIGERRLNTLRTLSTELNKAITEEDVTSSVSRCLEENRKDVPFTLTYLLTPDGKQAELCCHSGIAAGHRAAPARLELSDSNRVWPMEEIVSGKDSLIIENLADRFGPLPSGFWDKPPTRALLLPITSQIQGTVAGIFVAGLNPYRPLDVGYAGFISLVAGQIAAGIANARAYEQEKRRAEALAEIDLAKTAFFSNVSHEFRTPLTLMLGPLEDLLSRSQTHLSPTAKEQLELVNRNGARLLRLVNTLLDFSRLEAGRYQARYQPTDLSRFTSELASVFRSATEKARLGLFVECADLGEQVYVDRDMWEKIVLNLLSNAFKFTFRGEIAVTVQRAGDFAELRVRDTGVGIPAEAIPRLFERFHRVPNTRSRTHEGTGIGLALVQEFVKLHGGSIRVESKVGEGSTFIVSMPFGKNHLASGQINEAGSLDSPTLGAKPFVEEALRWLPDDPQENGEAAMDEEFLSVPGSRISELGWRPRILIADDNADMRHYLARLLSEQYEVDTAPDGQSALQLARDRSPNLILSDVMMPQLDGFQLLAAVRGDDRTRRIPVVLLSARAGEESRIEGLQAGADDYLVKPFSARELLARVGARLEITRLQNQQAEWLEKQVQARTAELEHRTAELLRHSDDIRRLSSRLLQIQDEERRHIARELHDSAGQTLAVLSMNLARLIREAEAQAPNLAARVKEAEEIVKQLQSEIRTTSYLLHPPLLDECGLSSALQVYVAGVRERTGLEIDLSVAESVGRIPREMESVVFRLVQECLTNIHRHSRSRSAAIQLMREENVLTLAVRDQGTGISEKRFAEIQAGGAGVGIRGMKERVQHFGGTLEVCSDASGTSVNATLPITGQATH